VRRVEKLGDVSPEFELGAWLVGMLTLIMALLVEGKLVVCELCWVFVGWGQACASRECGSILISSCTTSASGAC
jgi:hypothetical protein